MTVVDAVPATERFARFVGNNSMKIGEQLEVLAAYIDLQRLFPQITFDEYLARIPATRSEESALSVLNTTCPPKRGGHWTPTRRCDVLGTYVTYLGFLAPGEAVLPFATFAAEEAASVGESLAMPPPTFPSLPPVIAPVPPPVSVVPTQPQLPAEVVPAEPVPGQTFSIALKHTELNELTSFILRDGTVPPPTEYNAVLWERQYQLGACGTLHVAATNATPRPFLDVYVMQGETVVAELPPIERFQIVDAAGTLVLPPELLFEVPNIGHVIVNVQWGL